MGDLYRFNSPNKRIFSSIYEKLMVTSLRELHEDPSRYLRAFKLGSSLND